MNTLRHASCKQCTKEIPIIMAEKVKESQVVLLIWSGRTPPKKMEEIVVQLNSKVGPAGKVSVEHEERLQLC